MASDETMKPCECMKTDKLCEDCRKKLDNNIITQKEIELAKSIYKLAKIHPELNEVEIKHIIDIGKILVFVEPQDVKKIIGPGSQYVRELSDMVKKYVRINAIPRSTKGFIKSLLGNVPINRIDTIYTNDGELFRICINRRYSSKISISPENFGKIMKELSNKNIELVFE